MTMIIPSNLKKGDRIRIVSPAGKTSPEKILPGIELLRLQGFEVIIGKHVFGEHFQYSGTDEERIADFQQAIDDQQTKAIICSRGGYGSARILDRIDFQPLIRQAKWLVGFSDITAFHLAFQSLEIASIHGPMPGFFIQNEQTSEGFQKLTDTLTGQFPIYETTANTLNRQGTASGELVGGNLSLLYSLAGTRFDINTAGKILLIEDLNEYLYHLDRMMTNLKLSGKLDKLAGLIVGGFTDMKDNDCPFGKTSAEIILDAVQGKTYPVCFDFPCGHIDQNMPLILGKEYSLKIDRQKVWLG